jgi:phosphate transport system permease protein
MEHWARGGTESVVSDDPSAHGLSAFDVTLPDIPAGPSGPNAPRRPPVKRNLKARPSLSDLVFRAIARAGGSVVLIIMILVGTFLAYRASQALHVAGWSFLTTQAWNPNNATAGGFGVAAVMTGTFLIAITAVVIAIPLAIGAAMYISEYAPRSLQRLLIMMIDLMAAVPSIVFGLWGAYLLQWKLVSLERWISDWFYWIPIFQVNGVQRTDAAPPQTNFTSSTFAAGVVVALMITPIAASVIREAYSQAPIGEREGAYALGATRWGMIRAVVLPFSKGAMIGGLMLGLGRALGETIAVTTIISIVFAIQPHILQHGGSAVSALIAAQFTEATPFGISALMAAGLALFVVTLLVNFIAAGIIARSRSGAQSEA